MDPSRVIADVEYECIVRWVTGTRGYGGLRALLGGESATFRCRRRCAVWSCTLALLGECGLRVGEAVGLVREDVWGEGQPKSALIVRRENSHYGKTRMVPLVGSAWEACYVYGRLRCGCDDSPTVGAWIVSGPDKSHISTRTVQRWTEVWGVQAIGRKVHPHAFRHFCIDRLRRVADIVTVAEIAGHRSVRTTQRYTHVGAQDMRSAMDAVGALATRP